MGRPLPTHPNHRLGTSVPSQELLEPFIERTPNHWYWLDEFLDDHVDRTAVFRWSREDHNATTWIVARLLWCAAHPDENPVRLSLMNLCGLFTCINPEHWEHVNRKRNFTLPTDSDAFLCSRPQTRPSLHVEDVHIAPPETSYTMCGSVVSDHRHPSGTVITCKTCLREWQGFGRPLVEIKP